MPEWSIGAVSKTVDQLAGPRVRIPVSPPKKISQVPKTTCEIFFVPKKNLFKNLNLVYFFYKINLNLV